MQRKKLGPTAYSVLLKKGKVALNAGSEFLPGGENFARLNFGCPRATLVEALQRIKEAVS